MTDKVEFTMEFVVKASPKMLYKFLSTPSGLSEWFSDNVNSRGKKFTFIWEDSEEVAELINKKADKHIRFKWVEDEDPNSFFEFKIEIDELTNDVSLIVTDFAEEDEIEEAQMLWESQVNTLLHAIGS
ncbi:MAG: SRPBCC domain-containing protein [Bacteroidetes bacterium]|nr:MAG: SRPBCC domain-containing protein [Bacteroidota bacterium]MBL1145459.1 SRPBCC domain-containing protein [Bacteroidota bacterium]MCB0802417.1 SRPBCC domain-containing protein [Flavobacteriales bacterium]NOG58257.1 SRPBCC domain-containing protein [Bacteroidota bacterium]